MRWEPAPEGEWEGRAVMSERVPETVAVSRNWKKFSFWRGRVLTWVEPRGMGLGHPVTLNSR